MDFWSQLFDPAVRFQRQYAEYLITRFRCLAYPGTRITLEAEWIEPRGLAVALAHDPRVVLTGASGMGKTTALAYLAVSHARALQQDARARVPLLFAGRDLQTVPHIPDLPRGLNLSDSLAAQCPRIFFAGVFASGRALVLIDDADVLTRDQLQMCLKEFQDAQIIVSAQTALPGFAEFQLPGFRDRDVEAFAEKWDAPNAGAFIAALKASGVPGSLTASPMTLGLLARLWQSERVLPPRRAELFDAYTQRVLGGSNETTKMLEGVALAIQRGRPAPNEFLAKARGFMRAGKNRTAEFVHDLWQAYFAARALRESPTFAPLRKHLSEPAPAWRDTILFYAGLGDASELVENLLSRGDVFLAGRAIAYARAVRSDLRASVTQELMGCAWNGDECAMRVLSEMQSEIAVDGCAAKLKDRDPAVRKRAAEILGHLRLNRGVEYLLPQLRDVNDDVRDKVVEALGRSRTDRVIEPLLVALRGDPRVGTQDTRLRVAAAKALGAVASDKAVPALIVDLQLGEPEVRAAAAEALKQINSPLMIKPLQDILRSEDEEARAYAADVLAAVNGRSGSRIADGV